MIADQQRGLLGQSLPAGGLKPEVVLTQDIPDRLLNPQELLVGAFQGVFGSGRDTLADQAFDPTFGLAIATFGLVLRSRIEGRLAAAVVHSRCARERTVELSPLPGRWSRDGWHEQSLLLARREPQRTVLVTSIARTDTHRLTHQQTNEWAI